MSAFNDLINGEKPVLVDFFAVWCGPCKMMAPILKNVKDSMGDAVTIIKIDIDKNRDAATTYQIQSVPTLVLFKQGKVVWRQSGVLQPAQIEAIVKQHI